MNLQEELFHCTRPMILTVRHLKEHFPAIGTTFYAFNVCDVRLLRRKTSLLVAASHQMLV